MKTLIIARNTAHKALLKSGLNPDSFEVAVLGDVFAPDAQYTQALMCELHSSDPTFLAKHKAWMLQVVRHHLTAVEVEL